MSEIVNRALPALRDMILGHWNGYPDNLRQEIANWVALTSMSYEFRQRSTAVIPLAERRRFSQGGRVDGRWVIAIGHTDALPSGLEDFLNHASGASRFGEPFALPAIRLGQLFCISIFNGTRMPFEPALRLDSLNLIKLWPDTGQKLWKPLKSVYDEAPLYALGEIMQRFVRHHNISFAHTSNLRAPISYIT